MNAATTAPAPAGKHATPPYIDLEELGRQETARLRRQWGKRRVLVLFAQILLVVATVGLWHLSGEQGWVDPFFSGTPLGVVDAFQEEWESGRLASDTIVTVREFVTAWIIGSTAGVLAGFLLSQTRFLRDVLGPFLVAINAMPRVAVAPLFILWFGIGEASKIWLAVSIVFFIALSGAEAGVRSADAELVRMVRGHGGSRRQTFVKVVLPGAIPAVFAALRLGAVYALLGVVFGEMLAAEAGLGMRVTQYQNLFQINGVLAIVLWLAVISVVLSAFLAFVERRLDRWQA